MFIQVITGKVTDADGFRREGAKWGTDVKPTATGFLGSTAGATNDGRFLVAARFESAEAAAKNNESPAQAAWYPGFEKTVSDVEFHDCDEVVTMLGGGKDDAGFVQVMVGKIKDKAKFDALNARVDEMEKAFSAWRDDVVGEAMAIEADGSGFYDLVYFKSEAEARANEQKEPTPEVQALMAEMDDAADIVDYLDLTEVMFD